MFKMVLDVEKGIGGSKWESAARVLYICGGAEVPLYPVVTVHRV